MLQNLDIDEKMAGISKNTFKKVRFLLYPEDQFKSYWDMSMTFLIFITCILTPINMAFTKDEENFGIQVFDSVINVLFFIDVMIQFNTAFYDSDFNIIDDRKVRTIVTLNPALY